MAAVRNITGLFLFGLCYVWFVECFGWFVQQVILTYPQHELCPYIRHHCLANLPALSTQTIIEYKAHDLIRSDSTGMSKFTPEIWRVHTDLIRFGSRETVWGAIKRILVYFEVYITLLFAPICRCFGFIKQCFMSHWGWGVRPRYGGNFSLT